MLYVDHVDTCLPCYVTDHCNGDNESLIGICLTSDMTFRDVYDELYNEISNDGESIPEHITEDMVTEALNDCFSGDNMSGLFCDDIGYNDEDDMGESPCAWFRICWD